MATYTLISSYTVGSGGVSNFTFSSIPSIYTDLVMKVSARTDEAALYSGILLWINNDSTSFTYDYRRILGNGSTATSASATNNGEMYINYAANGDSATASTFGNAEFYFPNYTSSNHKSVSVDAITENNATTSYTTLQAHVWKTTSPITSIVVNPPSGGVLFKQNSTFQLYGISNA